MANKSYRKAYEAAAKELSDALAERKQIDARILSLRKTVNVLSTLLREQGEKESWLQNTLAVLGKLGEPIQKASLTDEILAAIANAGRPLTSTEIKNELSKFTQVLEGHSNPLATINAVAKRLVEQGKIEKVEKDGRTAWRVKGVSLLSMLESGPDAALRMMGLTTAPQTRKERAMQILAQAREARQKKGNE
ncbi:MAG TPA: hypothetical protein VKY85_24965 [Candidatus Angelobacter sp.]|nr:hypothetical protein [Candidatus Angelobacter sp.]